MALKLSYIATVMSSQRSARSGVALRSTALRATALAALGAVTLSGIAAAAAFPPLTGDPPPPPSENPRAPLPDIVAIVLDDIPPLDGRLWDRLPNIRRTFVRQGTQFTDAHGETPTCTPGRVGFLTGQHSHNHGAYRNDGTYFDPSESVATELQAQGYHTIHVGKYVNLFERVLDKFPPGWDEFHGYGGGYYGYNLYSNGVGRHHGRKPRDYSTDVIARLASGALKRAPEDQPLFAWITPFSMHKPWSVAPRHQHSGRCDLKKWRPQGYMERDVRDKPAYVGTRRIVLPGGYDIDRICRGLLSVDELVGDVVRKLDRLGRLDNTLLVLTSDNGMAYGSQRFLHDKKAPYGTAIPLFVRWERVLGTVPKRVRERVQNIDLAPTLCDIAGCRMGPYPSGRTRADGTSFLRLLGDRKHLARNVVLTSYQDEGHRVPTYWSVTSTGSSPLSKQLCATRKKSGCRWMYTEYETGAVELYDLSNGPCYSWKRSQSGDPCMLRNKAGKRKFGQIERALQLELARLRPSP
jgi:arylsulfatase A-like enzyme